MMFSIIFSLITKLADNPAREIVLDGPVKHQNMPFSCSCFISYPHNAGKSVDAFVTRLKEELEDRLGPFVPNVVVKTDHDFLTGADFNKAIAQWICRSACLLVVYMPVYQRKTFCLQEYTAMERLEVERYKALQQDLSAQFGMIVPLVYTGEEHNIPTWISKKRNYKNIREHTVAGPQNVFKQKDFKAWLGTIAQMIHNLQTTFDASPANPCLACNTYALPAGDDPEVAAKLNIPVAPTESFR
jgi:hypothetical protein